MRFNGWRPHRRIPFYLLVNSAGEYASNDTLDMSPAINKYTANESEAWFTTNRSEAEAWARVRKLTVVTRYADE